MNLQRLRAKQFFWDRDIDANQNLLRNTSTPILGGDVANKAYVDAMFCWLSRKLVASTDNLDMQALQTANNGDLACSEPLAVTPESYVQVEINGVEINICQDKVNYLQFDAYFQSPTGDKRNPGEEQAGDRLYWNPAVAGYNLSPTDLIDFQYDVYEDTNCAPMNLPSPYGVTLTNDGYTYSLTVGTDTVVWYKDIDQLVDLAEISPNKYKLTVDNREVVWSNDMSLIDNNGTATLRIDGQIVSWDLNPSSDDVSLLNGGNGNWALTVNGQTVNFNVNGMGNPMQPTTSTVLLLTDGAGHYSLTVDDTTVNWGVETDPEVSVDTISPGVYTLTVRGETIQWTDLVSQQVLLHDNGDYTAELTVDGDTVTVLLEGYVGAGSGGGSNVTAVNNPNGTTTFTVNGIPYTVVRVENDPTFGIVDNGTTGTITSDGQNFTYVEQETDPTVQFINNGNGTATLIKGITSITVLTAGGGSGSGNQTQITNNNNGTYTISNGVTSAILLGSTYVTSSDNGNNTTTVTINGLSSVLTNPGYFGLVNNGNGTGTVTVGTTNVTFSTTPTALTNNPNGTATLQVGSTTATLLTQEFDPNVTFVDNGNNTALLTVQGLAKNVLTQGFATFADNGNNTAALSIGGLNKTVLLSGYTTLVDNGNSTYNLTVGNTTALINKGNIDGTGSAGFLPVFTDTDTIANSFISQSSTEVIVYKNLVPSASELFNLGSTAEFWQNIYMNNSIVFNDAFNIQKFGGVGSIVTIDRNDKVYINTQGNQNAGSLLLSNGAGELIWTSATDFISAHPEIQAPIAYKGDKEWVSLATTGNGQLASNNTITAAPYENSYITVYVNGIEYLVGDGDKTKDCYFSGDNGVSARGFSASHPNGKVSIGDKLYWNSSIIYINLQAGYRIAVHYLIKQN